MNIAWLTDPHLNFAGISGAEALCAEVSRRGARALLVGGDIGEAPDLEGWLELMAQRMRPDPVYFVLGNHDFYHGSIASVRARCAELTEAVDNLWWLGACPEPVALTAQTGLVGHDGWGDGRAGDVETSRVHLADFVCIQELRVCTHPELIARLAELGDEAAAFVRPRLRAALDEFAHVIVLTHVPPLRQAAWHEGGPSDDEWAPFFVCQAVGDVLLELAAQAPQVQITVLCGHTHSAGQVWAAPNVRILTGAATYRKPALQPPLAIL